MKKIHIEDLRTGEKEYILSFDGYIKIEEIGAFISGRKFKLSVTEHIEINKTSNDMKDKINEICNKLNREQLSVYGATNELFDLYSVSQRYTIEDIEKCVENWGLCKVEKEYIEQFLNGG